MSTLKVVVIGMILLLAVVASVSASVTLTDYWFEHMVGQVMSGKVGGSDSLFTDENHYDLTNALAKKNINESKFVLHARSYFVEKARKELKIARTNDGPTPANKIIGGYILGLPTLGITPEDIGITKIELADAIVVLEKIVGERQKLLAIGHATEMSHYQQIKEMADPKAAAEAFAKAIQDKDFYIYTIRVEEQHRDEANVDLLWRYYRECVHPID